jgi:hypothetical protein
MTADVSDWVLYRSDSLRFALRHLKEWPVVERWLGCALVSMAPAEAEDSFRPNFNLSIQTSKDTDLESFVEAQLQSNRRFLTDYSLERSEEASIAAKRARLLKATYRQGQFDVALTQFVIEDEDRFVILSGAAAPADVQAFDEVFETVAQSLELG